MESVSQFSRSVVSNSLSWNGMQHARPPCLSPTPRAYWTHVCWVNDAIQPSHPLSFPSPASDLSQHQCLLQRVSSSHQVAKVLEFQLQSESFNKYSGLISFRMEWLELLAVQALLPNSLREDSASICWSFTFIYRNKETMGETEGNLKK